MKGAGDGVIKRTVYFVEYLDKHGKALPHSHGSDEETGELWYEFLSRSAANKEMKEQKKKQPGVKFRVARQVEIFKLFAGDFE